MCCNACMVCMFPPTLKLMRRFWWNKNENNPWNSGVFLAKFNNCEPSMSKIANKTQLGTYNKLNRKKCIHDYY